MADRYWVGGTATWDSTAGSKWATSSGGASGAAAPTAADDVYFDAASSGTVTLSSSTVARSINCTGFTGTISHPAATTISIGDATAGAGNIALLLVSGMTYTLGNATTSAINFVSTSATVQTITTAGKTLAQLTFNGVGGSWQLADSLTLGSAAAIFLTRGTLDFNGTTSTIGGLDLEGANARTLTLGSATLTIIGSAASSGNAMTFITTTNLTISANTASINITGSGNVNGTGNFNGASITVNPAGIVRFGAPTGSALTFANVTLLGAANKTTAPSLRGSLTVTGTLTITGNSVVNRMLFTSNSEGTAVSVSAAAVALTNCDFRDISASGAAAPWTGTSLGNAQGNTNITTDTPVTRYWVGGTGNWDSSSRWSASSGGSSGASVPLCHDDVVIDANSGTGTITQNQARAGANINMTGYTGTFTTGSAGCDVQGSWTLGSGTIYTPGASGPSFKGRGSFTINLNGALPGNSYFFWMIGGTYTLQSNITYATSGNLQIMAGTLNLNGYTISCASFISSTNVTRVLNLGSGGFNLAGTGTVWSMTNPGTLTINSGTSTIALTGTTGDAKTFGGGDKSYYNLTMNGGYSSALTITGANTFNTLSVGAQTVLTMPSSTTNTINSDFVANGVSNDYVHLPGSGTENVTTPSSAALNITGDIDLRTRVALNDWTPSSPQCIITKWATSYAFRVTTSGALQLFLTPDNGPTQLFATSSAAPTVSDGQPLWLRATWRASDGRVQFFTASGALSNPSVGDFTQLGSDQTINIGAMSYSAGTAVQISGYATSQALAGKVYRAQIYNGIDGTLAFDADFSTKAFGANSFTESSANAATVTINGVQAQAGDGRILINSSSSGTPATLSKSSGTVAGNYLSIKDSTATGGATWYAGANSVSVSGNTGWIFAAPSYGRAWFDILGR